MAHNARRHGTRQGPVLQKAMRNMGQSVNCRAKVRKNTTNCLPLRSLYRAPTARRHFVLLLNSFIMLPSFQKKEVLTFRCFSRKGLCTVCLPAPRSAHRGALGRDAALGRAAPVRRGSQLRATDVRPDSATTLQLKAASVSGTRAPLAAEQAARMVTTLTAGGHRRGGRRLGQ